MWGALIHSFLHSYYVPSTRDTKIKKDPRLSFKFHTSEREGIGVAKICVLIALSQELIHVTQVQQWDSSANNNINASLAVCCLKPTVSYSLDTNFPLLNSLLLSFWIRFLLKHTQSFLDFSAASLPEPLKNMYLLVSDSTKDYSQGSITVSMTGDGY